MTNHLLCPNRNFATDLTNKNEQNMSERAAITKTNLQNQQAYEHFHTKKNITKSEICMNAPIPNPNHSVREIRPQPSNTNKPKNQIKYYESGMPHMEELHRIPSEPRVPQSTKNIKNGGPLKETKDKLESEKSIKDTSNANTIDIISVMNNGTEKENNLETNIESCLPNDEVSVTSPNPLQNIQPETQSEINKPTESIEQVYRPDPQSVRTYANEILAYCLNKELKNVNTFDYFTDLQKDINDKMRAVLIDWLVDVHNKFGMLHQTLAMTVNIIDRYLSKVMVPRQKLQLVGLAALFLSGKYEEIYPPDLKDYVTICDETYSANEIIEVEGHMLLVLNWDLVFNSSFYFYEMFSRHLHLNPETFNLGMLMLNLCLLEFSMNRFRPSVLALAVIF